jgi:nitroreductase
MELIDAIRCRRSTAPVTDDAPTDAELYDYLGVAAHSPDHAGLRPWRLVSLRGGDRNRLGAALAEGFGDAPGSPEAARTATKPLRAPLLLSILATPVQHPKVPAWEQLAATAALISTLQLVLFDAGWTAMWRSGPAVELPEVLRLIGVRDGEQLLGWLYVGGRTDTGLQVRPDPDVSGKISALP